MVNHGTSTTSAQIAILTVSDTRSLDEDKSGSCIESSMAKAGHVIHRREIVQDEQDQIANVITTWSKDRAIDTIIVNGGTGASPRDITPEAVLPLMDGMLDGFGELFRHLSYKEIGAAAMLSRATAGWIDNGSKRVLVFLLPGSPAAVKLAILELIVTQLGHLLDVCSMEVSK